MKRESDMKLYFDTLLNPRKACAVAKYLKSPVEFVAVDVGKGEHRTPQFMLLNPNAKVPLLVDGDKVIWESNAIMCHLATKASSDLWPQDDRQIDVLRWLMWDATEFAPQASTFYFEYIVKSRFKIGPPDVAEITKATAGFMRYAAVLEAHLRGRSYLVGDKLSVADFAVAITLPYADAAHIPLADFPEIRRWHALLNELEAWRDPFPTNSTPASAAA